MALEGVRPPHVAAQHLNGLVARDLGDPEHVDLPVGSRGHEAGLERMASELGGVMPGLRGVELHQVRGALVSQALGADGVGLGDGAEHGPRRDARGLQPRADGVDGADAAAVRDRDLHALPFLIGLRPRASLNDRAVAV
ncbi:hypothetical protein [Prosthecomicrobium sp. N25]|uniref:hypothetical protein n=1 Tax=Prosthecomicrobium sp. N25 TaxID=3129254 RepID=UPI003077F67C